MAKSTFELTDWTTVSGNGSSTQILQQRQGWAEVGTQADAVWYVEIKQRVGSPNVYVQTGYTDDDSTFQDISRLATIGTQLNVSRLATATTPVLGWLRWRVTGSAGSWSTTFRITGVLKNP